MTPQTEDRTGEPLGETAYDSVEKRDFLDEVDPRLSYRGRRRHLYASCGVLRISLWP